MPEQRGHAMLPWRVVRSETVPPVAVVSANDVLVALCTEADAELIVAAVNRYYETPPERGA